MNRDHKITEIHGLGESPGVVVCRLLPIRGSGVQIPAGADDLQELHGQAEV